MKLLPEGFEALEPFADNWAGETAAERAALRGAHPAEARNSFHAACEPLIEPGLALLDARPMAEWDEREQRLMRLLLTDAHICLAVDVQKDDEPKHAPLRATMRITCAPADRVPA